MGNSRLDAAGGPLGCEAGSAVNPWVTPSERGSYRAREEPSGGGDQASTAPWRAVAGGRRIATQDDPRPRTKGSWTRCGISAQSAGGCTWRIAAEAEGAAEFCGVGRG